MLNIIIDPNPILHKKSQPVTNFSDPKIQTLIPEMIKTMKQANGVGLAAPQIGQNIRLCVVVYMDTTLTMMNPQIIKKSFWQEKSEEGCLSLPQKFGKVKRHKNITVRYINEKGQEKILKAKGMLARIIQHEINHLDGVLFVDKIK